MTSYLGEENYIQKLHERCQKNHIDLPTYTDEQGGIAEGGFGTYKVICCLLGHTTEGVELSKKCAKQVAAKHMYNKIDSENLLQNGTASGTTNISSISKITEYVVVEKKDPPTYTQPETVENNMFQLSCTFQGVTKSGKAFSKKGAKEAAADEIAKHFSIHQWHETRQQKKTNVTNKKNPQMKLHEYAQSNKIFTHFTQEKVGDGKTVSYIVSCRVKDTVVKSEPCFSLKIAKQNAADLMLKTLTSAPATENGEEAEESMAVALPSDDDLSPGGKRTKTATHQSEDPSPIERPSRDSPSKLRRRK